MQELRFVLIVVGALAIAALLFHGLWTSKKEGKAKFGNKPLGKLDVDQVDRENKELEREFAPAPEDDFEIIRKDRKEPDFGIESSFDNKFASDPLIDDVLDEKERERKEEAIPAFVATKAESDIEPLMQEPIQPVVDESIIEPVFEPLEVTPVEDTPLQAEQAEEPKSAPEMQVIVLNVHCAGDEPFVGTKLFDSMQQNGLIYGEMDIFHRHVDLSGNGKVLFSVANMMHPGTLAHNDPAEFTTKGISFFMTLPCYGEADQNFNLMLRTAQLIADDMGGNVLDDKRNLMTPDRLSSYRRQIVEFTTASA
ncbi:MULTISPECIES: cell division protein ZipA [Vibrio]|jgi:cell division protein ZipA|uniref:cell division protein ZipA n=1 Tax=Vibrio TaxID=662 RepID=UPI000BFFC19B|nr:MULTISPECIES: cell division protein ZipA [unclassified Vibrio]PHJ41981.1 cell division protein ZipA [Vibrio sp. PID17_43]RIZ56007.1 cell division protein ZipA [Vibrio sp. PID23_8]